MASGKQSNKGKTRSTCSVSEAQPTITEVMSKSGVIEGAEKSECDRIIKLLTEWDKKWENRFEKLQGSVSSKIENIDKKFAKVFGELSSELKTFKEKTEQDYSDVRGKVDDIESSMEFYANEVELVRGACEKIEQSSKAEVKNRDVLVKKSVNEMATTVTKPLEEEIKRLRLNLLRLEKNERKYNLIFYGIPQNQNEDAYTVLRGFLIETLGMELDSVNDISFVNVHRLPHNREGPKPMIARFALYEDREEVFRRVRSLPKGVRILSDLPVIMKTARSRLASEAYKLRNPESGDKRQTRILERDLKLILETRLNSGDQWKTHSTEAFDT